MVAVAGLCAVVVTILSSSAGEGPGRMRVRRDTALATTPSTGVALWQREVTSRIAKDDDFLSMLVSKAKDGVSMASTALDVVHWPLVVALSLHSSALTQIGALITWFNFLVSFVTPGGVGAALIAWLRGGPGKMARLGPSRRSRFNKVNMEL